jgi:hypothetical protein
VYREVGQNLPEGLPVTAYGLELLKQRIAGDGRQNPSAQCLPMGIVQLHTQGAPRKCVQTPDLLAILYEAGGEARQIFTDGRPSPASDPQPWWYGYSVGRWDGDDLVVTTTGFRDGGWLDTQRGRPHSDALRVTERLRRRSIGRMDMSITIDDPKAFEKPWTVTVPFRLVADSELLEGSCESHDRTTQHRRADSPPPEPPSPRVP